MVSTRECESRSGGSSPLFPTMILIRRMIDKHRAYTCIFLPGCEPKVFPTTDYEHGRILEIFKQDKPYEGIINDFNDDLLP